MRDPLFTRIAEYIRKHQMLQRGSCVMAAVSGGADSVFLLYALKEISRVLPFDIRVIHVEHGIRGEDSLRDAAFVEQLCKEEKISCRIEHVDAPAFAKQSGTGIEEAARTLRYQVLEQSAKTEQADRIVVAHHMEDNAETMLFHLARGTGLAGLAGIPPVRGQIIRPLLCVSRDEIETWLVKNGKSWCLDETNTDISFSRNLIRAEILPYLKKINPSAVSHMAETAELLRKTSAFLDHETENAVSKIKCNDRMELSMLRTLDPAVRDHLVYRSLQRAAGSVKDFTGEHVRSVCELIDRQVGKWVPLPYDVIAERTYDAILLYKSQACENGQNQKASEETIDMRSGIMLNVPGKTKAGTGCEIEAEIIVYDGNEEKIPQNAYTKWFDYDKINNSLQIRGRKTGDYLQIDKKGGHKSIQDYMVNEKIPAKERDKMRLLADGDHIVWIIGRRISEAYKVTRETTRVLVLEVTCAGSKGETI